MSKPKVRWIVLRKGQWLVEKTWPLFAVAAVIVGIWGGKKITEELKK